jgi:hypothetical protein
MIAVVMSWTLRPQTPSPSGSLALAPPADGSPHLDTKAADR